jgi:TPR repeat protein
VAKRLVLTIPEGVSYPALVYMWSAATSNGPEAAKAAQRAAYRNGCESITPDDYRSAVEFLRLLAATELARLGGAPASVVSGSSTALMETFDVSGGH